MRDPMKNPLLEMLMGKRSKGPGKTVKWRGTKHPRRVWWQGGYLETAQHGVLRDDGGRDVGTYRRVKEFSGPDKNEHEIVAWPLREQADTVAS